MSDLVWPHRQQPTRLSLPWDSPGKVSVTVTLERHLLDTTNKGCGSRGTAALNQLGSDAGLVTLILSH